ncbi:MAG: GNAT family N-acetyltransferase [Cytophagales bacterium]
MIATICPLSDKKQQVSIMSSLSPTDYEWAKSHNYKALQHIQILLSEAEQSYKIVKVEENNQIKLLYLFEITTINTTSLQDSSEPKCFLEKLSKTIFKWKQIHVGHPCCTLLYDFNYTIYDPSTLNSTKFQNMYLQSLDYVSSKLNVSILTLPTSSLEQFNKTLLENYCFQESLQDFTMQLNDVNKWQTFDDYLAELKRKYLKRAKTILDKSKNISYKNLNLDEILQNKNLLHSLYAQVTTSQNFILKSADVDHFENLKKIYGEEFQILAYYTNDEIVAFLSYFVFDNKMYVHYVGLDYAQNDKFDLYFNLLFKTIDIAITQKLETINYGRTSLDAKASLGAVPEHHNTYFKTYGLTRLLQKQIIKQLQSLESNSWKIRKPFKSEVLAEENI